MAVVAPLTAICATITSLARTPAGLLSVSEVLPNALLPEDTALRLMPEEAWIVEVLVAVGVAVGDGVLVAVDVPLGVLVTVDVFVGVPLGVLVGVLVGVLLAVGVVVGVEGPLVHDKLSLTLPPTSTACTVS